VARGQVSWAELEIDASEKHGTDAGSGNDFGVRTTGAQSKAAVDTGSGTDGATVTVSGSTQAKFGTDRGFGFKRYAAGGLTFLFRQGVKHATVGTTTAAKQSTDTGTSTETSTKVVQDSNKHGFDVGVGAESSKQPLKSMRRPDTGSGSDTARFIPAGSSVLPEVILEVAFASDPTSETQAYTVVSSDSSGKMIEFKTKRGRQDELRNPETGTMLTTLHNQARQFDPAYTLSPYYPNVQPVKSARIRVVRGSSTYYLFVGDIEQWPQKQDNRHNTAAIQANDGFDPLSQADLELFRPEELPGARINAILDAAEWPASARLIDTGETLLQQGALEGSALELVRQVVSDEDGYFFMAGDGKARFIERHSRFKPPYTTPYVTLSSRPNGTTKLPLADADYQVDKDFIRNQVRVKVAAEVDVNGVTVRDDREFFVEDAASKAEYRVRTLVYDSSAISNDNEAQTKAEYHLDRLKNPVVRVKSVTVEPQQDTNLWQHVLGREIGDRIAVEIFPVQIGTEQAVTFEGIIEYIEHTYVVGKWTTVWYLSPADMNGYWILGDSALGVLGTSTRLGF
jgi:hypothetical protein